MTYPCSPSQCVGAEGTNIKNAVTNALPSTWSVAVGTPTYSCMCYSSGSACSSTGNQCTGTQWPEYFVTLTASMQYTGIFLNTTIGSSYVVRSK